MCWWFFLAIQNLTHRFFAPYSQAQFAETRQQLPNQPVVGQWKPLAPTTRGQELQQSDLPVKDLGGGECEENQSVAQLNVSRLRSSSVEIREKGSEFLKEELHRAQKVRFWRKKYRSDFAAIINAGIIPKSFNGDHSMHSSMILCIVLIWWLSELCELVLNCSPIQFCLVSFFTYGAS